MEGGPAVFPHMRDECVLHRIPMDVIDVPIHIVLIRACMFPEPPLPYRALALGPARPRPLRLHAAFSKVPSREFLLDLPPACRVIIVAFWQSPDAVQVVRQEYHGDRLERTLGANDFQRSAEQITI